MKINYNNWSTKIFEGFYESNLYNSDSLYWITQTDREEGYLKENEEYDIDFEKFTDSVAKFAVEELKEVINQNDNIIKSMKYKRLYSPRYYNFETDSLLIDIDVNIKNLKNYCFRIHKNDFNQYLKDNFTSYDGFISFIENNICTFKEQYKTDKNKCLNVMIEYYLLTCIYDTFNLSNIDNYYETIYHNNLYETARECIYEHIYKTKIAA